MSFVVTQVGQEYFLQLITSEILLLHLYQNNWTPSYTDVVTNYTELAYYGYAPKLLTPSEWVIQVNVLNGDYYATFAQQSFNFVDPITVYGYYITDQYSGKLLLAERFVNAPIVLQPNGSVNITPTIGAM
jgi:hypothetical protein